VIEFLGAKRRCEKRSDHEQQQRASHGSML
jgi:hypothetical protein